MGAGNYYFSAPAGDSWSNMVYVDLQPTYWPDELDRRKEEFAQFIKNDADSQTALQAASDEEIRQEVEGVAWERWQAEHYGGTCDECSFYEDQAEQQHEYIFGALESAFPGSIDRPDRYSPKIGDATVIGQAGRMALAKAYTYYGDRIALIVTPKAELQDIVWSLENGAFAFERGWHRWQLAEMRAENARLASLKRSVESGALNREMEAVFKKMIGALHDFGLAKDMTFRGCAWTSSPYQGSELFKRIDRQLSHKRSVRSSVAIGIH